MTEHSAGSAQPDRLRLDVFAYPSPTTLRFVVFLVALLSAGASVGSWLHNVVFFDEWITVRNRCEQQAVQQIAGRSGVQATLDAIWAEGRCEAAVDRRRAAFDAAVRTAFRLQLPRRGRLTDRLY
jgi:hypothetical protein